MQNHLPQRILEEIMKVASGKANFEPRSANTKHQKDAVWNSKTQFSMDIHDLPGQRQEPAFRPSKRSSFKNSS